MDKIISPIKKRLIQFLEIEGIKKEEFFLTTGINGGNFKGVGAKSELGGDKIVKILTIYKNLNPDWLLSGQDSMYRAENDRKKIEEFENGRVKSVSERERVKYGAADKSESECVECKTKDKFIELLENENKAIKEVNELLKEKISNYEKIENTSIPIDIDPKKSKRGEFYTPEEAHL